MNTPSTTKTSRGRVITHPNRYTPTSPASSPPAGTTYSSITINGSE